METFIERINKLAVDSGENVPNIIGSNLVILEFKEFIKKLEQTFHMGTLYEGESIWKIIDELSGCKEVAKGEPK